MTGAAGAELLEGMLAIPSVSGREGRLAGWLCGHLGGLGFDARVDEVGNVIATWAARDRCPDVRAPAPGARDEVVLLGHLDTVPGDIPVRREGRRLFGRGAVDAKGPLAAAITAVSRLPCDGSRVTVIAAVEEEGSSRGARHLLDRRPPAQLVVLEPSGWEGITIGYKGSLRVTYRRTQPAGHGAGPLPSAADRAVEFLRTVQDEAGARNAGRPLFERLDVRVTGIAAACDGLEDVATMRLGFRLPPGEDPGRFLDSLSSHADGATLECDGSEPPIRADKSSALSRAFVKAIRSRGGEPRFKLKTGTSDMNILAPAWGCPSVAYGPGDSRLDHTPDESVDIDEWERGVDVLDTVLHSLVTGGAGAAR